MLTLVNIVCVREGDIYNYYNIYVWKGNRHSLLLYRKCVCVWVRKTELLHK